MYRTPYFARGYFGPTIAFFALVIAAACTRAPTPTSSCVDGKQNALPETISVTVLVVDEAGAGIAQATIEGAGPTATTDSAGRARVTLSSGPATVVVSAADYLSEPVPLDPSDKEPVAVRLFSRNGGKRWAMHSAGDVMFGRRFETGNDSAPLIPREDASNGARNVVAHVAPAFRAADVRTLNLETVVADFEESDAYPRKRFILLSRPGSMAGVSELKADVAILANNHQRDFLDVGISKTKENLAKAGLHFTGAVSSVTDTTEPAVVNVNGLRVAVTAFTSVDGSFVNDSYPHAPEAPPAMIDPDSRWLYDLRTWSFSAADFTIPSSNRWIGDAWATYEAGERAAMPATAASAFQSMTRVYPEIQDWVARRGHGGATPWVNATAAASIAQLAKTNDLVVVQIHGGFQFQEAASENVQQMAHAAIDAGASIVVCHHPHVLQGFEWYKGKLIAYSLGNFVFDQDFLTTFASVFLRTVWDGNKLLEARLIPVEIVGYRPTPVVGQAAKRTLLTLWDRSTLSALANRNADSSVRAFPAPMAPDVAQAHLVLERGTGRLISTAPTPQMLSLTVPAGGIVSLPDDSLVHSRLGLASNEKANVLIGRDLLGWGGFEDDMADGDVAPGAHWVTGNCASTVMREAPGQTFMRLSRAHNNSGTAQVHAGARVPLPLHRLYDPSGDGERGIDPAPSFTLSLRVRQPENAHGLIRVAWYYFDDADPSEDPTSDELGDSMLSLPSTGTAWKTVELPLEPPPGSHGRAPNMLLLYVQLPAPTTGEANLDVDDLAVIEWRDAQGMPDRFGAFTHVKNLGMTEQKLMVPVLDGTP